MSTEIEQEYLREIERLRGAIAAIQKATVDGFAMRLDGHKLYDYCDLVLNTNQK